MADAVTVYEKPTCTTCRKLVALLEEEGVAFERVNYMIDPLDAATLRSLLRKAGLGPRDVLRTREPEYSELGLADDGLDDEAVLKAIVEHPALLQRPIVERGARALLARPVERVRDLF